MLVFVYRFLVFGFEVGQVRRVFLGLVEQILAQPGGFQSFWESFSRVIAFPRLQAFVVGLAAERIVDFRNRLVATFTPDLYQPTQRFGAFRGRAVVKGQTEEFPLYVQRLLVLDIPNPAGNAPGKGTHGVEVKS